METKVTLFELLISSGGAIAAILGAWIHMKMNVAALNTEINYLKDAIQEEKSNNKDNHNDLSNKIDSIHKLLTEIQISVAKK